MKTDLSKEYRAYYRASRSPELVSFDQASYASLVGKGDPSGEQFKQCIEALYSTVYTLKFISKDNGRDFVVAKLEGLWWYDETVFKDVSMKDAPSHIPRDQWEYRLLIRVPDWIDKSLLSQAKEKAFSKKQNPLVRSVEYFQLAEGECVQLLHEGPYSTEPESLEKINDFVREHKLQRNGLHHEIYLSDFRKTEPSKLKTILREPVKRG